MVAIAQRNHIAVARVAQSGQDGEFVCLASRVDEHTGIQVWCEFIRESICVLNYAAVHIAGICVQGRRLPRYRFYDMRIAMTDLRDVVVTVQIATPVSAV